MEVVVLISLQDNELLTGGQILSRWILHRLSHPVTRFPSGEGKVLVAPFFEGLEELLETRIFRNRFDTQETFSFP